MEAVEALPAPAPLKPPRLGSLDAYRGFIMTLLAAAGFSFTQVAKNHGGQGVWAFLGYPFEHAPWRGCSFWDLIQPSFMFMVGTALPYSYAARRAKGDTDGLILAHTAWRSLLLVLLGIFLMSNTSKSTQWTFVNVLTQIGLGYFFLTLLRGRSLRCQFGALALILAGTWLAYLLTPAPTAPGPGVGAGFEHYDGFFSKHFNKNANLGHAIDLRFLNFFPQIPAFAFNAGGYATLNFVPSLATMLLGLMAGELLRGPRQPAEKLKGLLLAGGACLAFGVVCDPAILPFVKGDVYSLCPIVKRIWTPSFAVFCSGWTFLMLAFFYWAIDLKGRTSWAFPFVVVGMNSIAMYVLGMTLKGWTRDTIKTHLGQDLFAGPWGPFWQSTAVLLVFWVILFWMYRRKLFLKI